MKLKTFLTRPIVLLVISAILSALPLTFSSLFALSWVSFAPLFYVVITRSKDSLLKQLGRGFLYGFIYHAMVYYWFLWFYPLDYVKLTNSASVGVVCLAWFGISAVHGMLWCLPFVCAHFTKKISSNSAFLSLVAIVGIIAAQKITALGELCFPWVRVSLGQYKATPLIQSAALIGAEGIDLLILTINALITIAIVSKSKKRVAAIVVAASIFCVNLGFGIIRLTPNTQGQDLTVMTAQASIEQDEKWSSRGDKTCLEAYTALTKDNITDEVDLVLWPESAVPKIYKNVDSLKQYKKLSQEINTPILAGIILSSEKGNTNNAILVDENGVQTIYTKRQMVPFGEYMPYKSVLSKMFPALTELNIVEEDYVAGTTSAIMTVTGGKLGSFICFESIYPYLARQSTLDGAELLIEVTNDSWLEDSPAMYQHLSHGVFRSIENGRYLVRSANSGISAVIDDKGNIKSSLGINQQGVITETVQMIEKQTLYTKAGDVLFPTFCMAVLIWLVIIIIKRKKATD